MFVRKWHLSVMDSLEAGQKQLGSRRSKLSFMRYVFIHTPKLDRRVCVIIRLSAGQTFRDDRRVYVDNLSEVHHRVALEYI